MCTVGFLLCCASVPRACLKILLEWRHLGTDSGSPSSEGGRVGMDRNAPEVFRHLPGCVSGVEQRWRDPPPYTLLTHTTYSASHCPRLIVFRVW